MFDKNLDFSENKNPYMPSVKMLNAYIDAIKRIDCYPDYKNIEINNSIAEFFNINKENVTVTNGSLEGINLLPKVIKGNNVTLFVPTFWGYEDALNRCGYKVNIISLVNNLNYDVSKISEVVKQTDLIYLCNPNNPTLSYLKKDCLIELITTNPQCHFIIDETMLLFSSDFDSKTISKLVSFVPNLSVIASFSKIFSLSGIRSGVILSNEKVINSIKKIQIPYCISSIVQEVIPIALSDKAFLDESREKIEKNKELLCSYFKNVGDYEIISGLANFILVKLPKGFSSTKLTNYLIKNNIIIRNIKDFYPSLDGEWIRISVSTENNNKKLIKLIEEYQKEK